MADLEVFKLLF